MGNNHYPLGAASEVTGMGIGKAMQEKIETGYRADKPLTIINPSLGGVGRIPESVKEIFQASGWQVEEQAIAGREDVAEIILTPIGSAELKEYCDSRSIQLFAKPFNPKVLARAIERETECGETFILHLSDGLWGLSYHAATDYGTRIFEKLSPGRHVACRVPDPLGQGDACLVVSGSDWFLPEAMVQFYANGNIGFAGTHLLVELKPAKTV